MKHLIKRISFFPFSYVSTPKQSLYAIIRYNIVRHKWIILEKKYGDESVIIDYVHDLNEESGIVEEDFIVGYTD